MKKKFTFLMALFALMLITLPGIMQGQTKDPIVLFHETFGDNSGSARAWDDSYSVKSGVTAVYSSITSYTVSNVKQSKNTMGQTASALFSNQGLTGSIIIGPLNVSSYNTLSVTNYFGMSAGSWNTTYSFMKMSYSTNNSTYIEVTRTGGNPTGAVSNHNNYVLASYSLPDGAVSSTLYLKFEFYCYQKNKNNVEIGQAYFDEVELQGIENASSTTYTVTFDCNGGEGCPNDMTGIEPGSNNFTVPNNIPTKSCYTFDNVYLDGELHEYVPGQTYTIDSDLELTASWTLNKYNITYQAGEGSGSNHVDANQNCGSSYTIKAPATVGISAPAAKPYFTGWLGSDDNTYQTDDTYNVNAALTLTAQWTATAVYNVHYNCNGGTTNCPSDASYAENTEIQLPAAPTYANHTFNGWLCSDDLETYAAGADYTITTNVEFEAQWLENLAAPTITIEGVSNGTANTYYATVAITITAASGATIYYTTDGTDPTTGSSVYSDSFNVTTTGENTVKAMAVKAGNGNSPVASQTIIIVNPIATFTDGVYSEPMTSSNSFNNMINIDSLGSQKWQYNGTYTCAYINGYESFSNHANNDWLITPKMEITNGQLAIAFKTYHNSFGAGQLLVKYSANISGPWTNISFTEGNAGSFNNHEARITTDAEAVYVAFVYKSTNTSSGIWEIKDFTAKQCYSIIYDANNNSGATESYGPYAVGEVITVRANDGVDGNPYFEAPEGKELSQWNTNPDGISGTSYYPTTSSITIGTENVTLYAIWGDACTIIPTMASTTNSNVYVNDNGNKSWTVTFTSKATALGGCDISEYGFVYSTTEDTPTTSDNKAKVGETYETINTDFSYEKTGIDAGATIYVRSYAINAAGTAYGAVATITTEAFPTYTISYTTNGHAETSTTVYQGDAISGLLTTPNAAYIPAGYTFMGWYEGNYSSSTTAPTYVKNGDAINANKTLKAVFAVTNGVSVIGTLTSDEIASEFAASAQSYADSETSYVDGAFTWAARCQTNKDRHWIQLRQNATPSYIKIVAPSSISSIDITITSANNSSGGIDDIDMHDDFSASGNIYLNTTANSGTHVGTTSGSSVSDDEATITPSGNNTTLYLQVSAGARIWNVSVTCAALYYNYCTSVADIADNANINNDGELTGDVTISAGAYYLDQTITVPSGKTLTVNGTGVLVNNDVTRLIIEDGGQLVLSNSNTGVKATMQKTVSSWAGDKGDADGWYAISSPVNNIAIADFVKGGDNGHNVYRYDEPTRYWNEYRSDVNVAPYLEPFTNLDNGCGYLYRSTETGINFKGDVNVGSATYTLKYTDKSDNMNGFNLIGNPYSHNIFKGASTAAISNTYEEETILENDAYFFDTEKGEWILLKDGTAIAPTQAILVQAKTNTTLSIVNSTAGYVAQGDKYANDNIWFTVKNSEYYDDACVRFKKGRGLNKVEHRNDLAPMLYITKEGEDFASANMPDNTSVINIGFDAKTMGQYTFSLKAEGRYSYMHLIDKLTGEDVDMLIEDSYTFMGSPRDRKDRFVLRLNYNAAGIDTESDIFAYQSGSDIIVSGEGELQIFDVMGRMVMNQRIKGVQTINGINNGVYIFKLEGKTQKIVVR